MKHISTRCNAARVAVAALCVFACGAYALTPPDADSLLRETERKSQLPVSAALPPAPAAPTAEAAKGALVEVKTFRIVGASLLAEAELQVRPANLVGKTFRLQANYLATNLSCHQS